MSKLQLTLAGDIDEYDAVKQEALRADIAAQVAASGSIDGYS